MGRYEFSKEQIKKIEVVRGWEQSSVSKEAVRIARMEEVAGSIQELIALCGDDANRDGLADSPYRFIKAFAEYTKGYEEDPAAHLGKSFDVVYDELVLIKDIPFNSLCEHHFAPFFGVAHIAYIPQDNVITGLSKFARMLDAYAHRFQVQERLTSQVADTIEEVLNPMGSAVIIEAEHYCMCGRGVKKQGAKTITSSMRGVFRDKHEARQEVMDLALK